MNANACMCKCMTWWNSVMSQNHRRQTTDEAFKEHFFLLERGAFFRCFNFLSFIFIGKKQPINREGKDVSSIGTPLIQPRHWWWWGGDVCMRWTLMSSTYPEYDELGANAVEVHWNDSWRQQRGKQFKVWWQRHDCLIQLWQNLFGLTGSECLQSADLEVGRERVENEWALR